MTEVEQERERCFNIITDRIDIHLKITKSWPPESEPFQISAHSLTECLIIAQRIDDEKFIGMFSDILKND